MKILLSVVLLFAAATQILLAQTTTLTFPSIGGSSLPIREQSIPILAGEVFEVLTWAPSNYQSGSALSVEGINVALSPLIVGVDGVAYNPQRIVVAGPRTVSMSVPSNHQLVCTYKVTQVSTVATQNVASQVVVIPENASAPVDGILESSTDLTN